MSDYYDVECSSIPRVMYDFSTPACTPRSHGLDCFLGNGGFTQEACALSHLQKPSLSGALMYAQNAVRALSTSLRATRSLL